MRLRNPLRGIAAIAAIGAGSGIAFGLAQAGGEDPPPLWQPAPSAAAVPATEELRTAFPVLATSQRAAGQATDRTLLTGYVANAGLGMDADGARVVGATATGPIWLIPVDGGLCLGLEDTAAGELGAACEPGADVVARGLTVGDGATIYGIVPDAAETVTATPEGGVATPVTVSGSGVYALPFEDATIGVTDPEGLTEFDVSG
jgi:hypothetical protein